MDVVKLWSTILANSVCSIPTAYFVQGTANVHVLAYGCESSTSSSSLSPESDVSEQCHTSNVEPDERDEEEGDDEEDDDDYDRINEGRESPNLDNDEEEDAGTKEQQRKRKIHRNRYSREEYRCPSCPYTCTTEKAFLHHLRNCCSKEKSSEQQLELSCPICGKDRKGEQSMSIHMKKHKENKHFCCDICKFKTLQLKKLIQHRRMHTGEKPHLCPFCSYRSARRDNLRSHARRVHKKDSLPYDTFKPRNMVLEPSK